mgnify:CR=1 FL=1
MLESADLLHRLGSGVRPGGAASGASSGAASGSASGAWFARLVDRARAGELRSGRGVRPGGSSGVVLDDEDLAFASAAADAAESVGAGRVVVLIGGWLVGVDVARREIDACADAGSGVVLSGGEAVAVRGDGGGGGGGAVLGDGGCGGEDGAGGGEGAALRPLFWSGWAGGKRVVPVVTGRGGVGEGAGVCDGTACAVVGCSVMNASLAEALVRGPGAPGASGGEGA